MFSRFMPREGRFFDLFNEGAEEIVQGAVEFRALLQNLSDSEARVRKIKDIEHRADQITHRTVELLHKTFITPLDRDEIHRLISRMDDVVDFIDAAAQRIQLFDLREVTPELTQLAEICLQSAECVRQAIHGLQNLKDPDSLKRVCVDINQLENEADHVLRVGVAKLFREELDTRKLIKLKEIYELLEQVTDRCEDVANVIEGIVLENA